MKKADYGKAVREAPSASTKLQNNIANAFLEEPDHQFLHKDLARRFRIHPNALSAVFGKLGRRVYEILGWHPDGLHPSEFHWSSELLKSDNPGVRSSAADALGNLGPAAAPYANDIAQLLKSDKPGVRSSAANALGNLGLAAAPYANQIAQLLKSDNPSVRSSAADTLGNLGLAAAPYANDIAQLLKSDRSRRQ
jgi:HEAT repeat protein